MARRVKDRLDAEDKLEEVRAKICFINPSLRLVAEEAFDKSYAFGLHCFFSEIEDDLREILDALEADKKQTGPVAVPAETALM